MVKVLEVNVDDNGYGGVYAFALNLIENINREFQVDICSFERFESKDNIGYIESFGGKVRYCGHYGGVIRKNINCLKNLYKLIKDQDYDVIHVHSDVAYKLFLYALMSKLGGAKKVLIHSHSTGVDGKHRHIKKVLHSIAKNFLKYVADKFLACSDKAGRWMYTDDSNFTVVKNGIKVENFSYNKELRAGIRKELNLENNLVIGHIGRFCYQKNQLFLIDIFKQLKKQNPKSKLLFIGSYVGDSTDMDSVKAKVLELNLQDEVIFLGIRHDVPNLMQAMDCFLLPSRFEGLCIVGIEAQASGLSCFFSDTITRELEITDLCHFIGLDKAPEEWADIVLKNITIERRDMSQEISDAGYDIKTEVKKIEKIYMKGLEKAQCTPPRLMYLLTRELILAV